MRYSSENPYAVLQESGLPFVATERFGVDLLLGRSVSELDRYVVYVADSDVHAWKKYLTSSGARETNILGNLLLVGREDFADLALNEGVAPLEILAHDLRVMSPRYLTSNFAEIQRISPGLAEIILQRSSLDALNLSGRL